MTVNCQNSELNKDSVKISYGELQYFLEQDVKADYCDSIDVVQEELIQKQEIKIIRKKAFNRALWGGVVISFIIGLLI